MFASLVSSSSPSSLMPSYFIPPIPSPSSSSYVMKRLICRMRGSEKRDTWSNNPVLSLLTSLDSWLMLQESTSDTRKKRKSIDQDKLHKTHIPLFNNQQQKLSSLLRETNSKELHGHTMSLSWHGKGQKHCFSSIYYFHFSFHGWREGKSVRIRPHILLLQLSCYVALPHFFLPEITSIQNSLSLFMLLSYPTVDSLNHLEGWVSCLLPQVNVEWMWLERNEKTWVETFLTNFPFAPSRAFLSFHPHLCFLPFIFLWLLSNN